MKIAELAGRCLKARIVSWLNNGQVPAILPTIEGGGVVVAVYNNGRYMEPEVVRVPNSPGEMWGPDGPVQMGQPPQAPGEGEEGNDNGSTDG